MFRTALQTCMAILLLVMTLFLNGCGSSDSNESTPTTLKGVAAAGAPIIGSVTLKDSATPPRTITQPFLSDGTYRINVEGMTPPFILQASGKIGERVVSYCSVATKGEIGGTVNITPFTDLILSNMAQQLTQPLFSQYNPEAHQGLLTTEKLQIEMEQLQKKLKPILESAGLSASYDLLRTAFVADHTGFDAILDTIKVSPPGDGETVFQIQNLLTGQSIPDDFGQYEEETGFTVPPNGLTPEKGVDIIRSGTQIMDTFSAAVNSATPLSENSAFLALFHDDFLEYGKNKDAYIQWLQNNNLLRGLSFNAVTFQSWNNETQTALIRVQGKASTGIEINFNAFKIKQTDDTWTMAGNGFPVAFNVTAKACWSQADQRFESGLSLSIEDISGAAADQGVTYALISGPGFAQPVKMMPAAEGTSDYIYTGMPANFSNDRIDGEIIRESDGLTIGDITDGSIYHAVLYNAADQVISEGSFFLPKPPIARSIVQQTPALHFPSIEGTSPSGVIGFTGGILGVSCTTQGVRPTLLGAKLTTENDTTLQNAVFLLSGHNGTISFPQMDPVKHADVKAITVAAGNRIFQTSLQFHKLTGTWEFYFQNAQGQDDPITPIETLLIEHRHNTLSIYKKRGRIPYGTATIENGRTITFNHDNVAITATLQSNNTTVLGEALLAGTDTPKPFSCRRISTDTIPSTDGSLIFISRGCGLVVNKQVDVVAGDFVPNPADPTNPIIRIQTEHFTLEIPKNIAPMAYGLHEPGAPVVFFRKESAMVLACPTNNQVYQLTTGILNIISYENDPNDPNGFIEGEIISNIASNHSFNASFFLKLQWPPQL